MSTLNSPRLPGVSILHSDATGAEYSRWRRGIRFACEMKGTWGYCDGSHQMPMPKKGSNRTCHGVSTTTSQPSLLDERRAWVRQDREVKLDIFLSLSEEIMEEIFHVGPPLPPSNLNAQQMLEALDKRFTAFKFEDYHHAFCHFLNLHMDQYASLEDFNIEFQTTLEDLHDYGYPLSNVQACSAYFSKLRCTQNPWVAQKLEEWESQSPVPTLQDLMKQSIPWPCKPSAATSSPNLETESIPEEMVDDSSSQSDTDGSSRSSPSNFHSRQTSNTTAHSLEITIHATSDDIADIVSFPRLPATKYTPTTPSYPLSPKESMPLMPLPAPLNRPLPPIPTHVLQASPRARSASPRIMIPSRNADIASPKSSSDSTPRAATPTRTPPLPQTPLLRLETAHPTLRPKQSLLDQKEFGPKPTPSPITPGETKIHPALRQATANPAPRFSPPLQTQPFSVSEANIPIPWPNTPDRPHSSKAALPFPQPPKPPIELDALTRLRAFSGATSTTSLPLTGSRAVSPPRLSERPLLRSTATSPPLGSASPPMVSPPLVWQARTPTFKAGVPSRTPTFESLGVPGCESPDKMGSGRGGIERARSPVRELVARLSGESGEDPWEREVPKARKKSWSMGVSLGRFGAGKGVKEII